MTEEEAKQKAYNDEKKSKALEIKLLNIKMERIRDYSLGEAIKWGCIGMAVAGTGVLVASKNNVKFNKYMSVSAKTSLPIMSGLFLFALNYETTIYDASNNPEKYGLSDEIMKVGRVTRIAIHHQVLNSAYDHPFRVIAGLGLPLAGYILNEQLKLKHLKFSQRIMHTRVFAQFGILSILCCTMSFRNYMDKHGRFPEPDGAEEIVEEGKPMKIN
jgi:hypothetical protein